MTERTLWEKDDPLTTIGRRLNSMRRKLMFAEAEVQRINSQNDTLSNTFHALQNTVTETEKSLEIVQTKIHEFPMLALVGPAILLRIEQADSTVDDIQEARNWITEISSIILDIFPLAMKLENHIDILSEKIPLVLHMYLRQIEDVELKKAIKIPALLVTKMLERLNIDPQAIFVLGDIFSVIELVGTEKKLNQYIVQIPLSQYQNILSWLPLGHEVGHILYSYLNEAIQKDIQPLVMDKVGYSANRYWILNWFKEFFSDAVMTEFFGTAAILDLDSLLAFERTNEMKKNTAAIVSVLSDLLNQIEKRKEGLLEEVSLNTEGFDELERDVENYECSETNLQNSSHGSHPPSLLRLKMMFDYLDARIGSNAGVEILKANLRPSYETSVQNSPYPWCEENFRNLVTQIIIKHIESTKIENNLEKFKGTVFDILDEKDVTAHNLIEIIYAINLCYLQQHSPGVGDIEDKPEQVYKQILQKYEI